MEYLFSKLTCSEKYSIHVYLWVDMYILLIGIYFILKSNKMWDDTEG